MNSYLILVLNLFCGLCLFVFGIRFFSKEFQKLWGNWQIKIFNFLLNNFFSTWVLGFFLTSICCYPSVIRIVSISYLSAGLMNFHQAFALILGSYLGLNFLPCILFIVSYFDAFILIGIGFFLFLFVFFRPISILGKCIISLGFIILGITIITHNVELLNFSDNLALQYLKDNSLIAVISGLIIGFIINFFFSTSHISLLIVIIGLISGILTDEFVIGIITGNTYSISLAFFSSSWKKKKVSGLLIKNIIITSFVLMFISILIMFYAKEYIASINFYPTVFSPELVKISLYYFFITFISLLFLPLGFFGNIFNLNKTSDKANKESQKIIFLHKDLYLTPFLTIELIKQEIKKLAAMVYNILNFTKEDLFKQEFKNKIQVIKYQNITVNVYKEISDYVHKLVQSWVPRKKSAEIIQFFPLISCLKEISCQSTKILTIIENNENNFDKDQNYKNNINMREFDLIFTEIINLYDEIFVSSLIVDKNKLKNISGRIDCLHPKIRNFVVQSKNENIFNVELTIYLFSLLTNIEQIYFSLAHAQNIQN